MSKNWSSFQALSVPSKNDDIDTIWSYLQRGLELSAYLEYVYVLRFEPQEYHQLLSHFIRVSIYSTLQVSVHLRGSQRAYPLVRL